MESCAWELGLHCCSFVFLVQDKSENSTEVLATFVLPVPSSHWPAVVKTMQTNGKGT